MLTREQIEAWLAEASANNWGAPLSTDDQATVLHLALLGLDAGKDARLGARVRRAIKEAAHDSHMKPLSLAYDVEDRFCDESANGTVWSVFSAIADALREEASDGDV